MKFLILAFSSVLSLSAFSSTIEDYLGTFQGKSNQLSSPICQFIVSEEEDGNINFKLLQTEDEESISVSLNRAEVEEKLSNKHFKLFNKIQKVSSETRLWTSLRITERYWDDSLERPWNIDASQVIMTKQGGNTYTEMPKHITCENLTRIK